MKRKISDSTEDREERKEKMDGEEKRLVRKIPRGPPWREEKGQRLGGEVWEVGTCVIRTLSASMCSVSTREGVQVGLAAQQLVRSALARPGMQKVKTLRDLLGPAIDNSMGRVQGDGRRGGMEEREKERKRREGRRKRKREKLEGKGEKSGKDSSIADGENNGGNCKFRVKRA